MPLQLQLKENPSCSASKDLRPAADFLRMLWVSFITKGFIHLPQNLSSASSVKHVKISYGCDTHTTSALLPILPPLSSYVLELVTPTYQILDHDFNLFLSHIHIFCRSFQSDFILSFSEFDVNLETQSNEPSKNFPRYKPSQCC